MKDALAAAGNATTAAAVERLATWVWGPHPLLVEGVVQPLAVWGGDGPLRVIDIDEHAPKSVIDGFALGFTRHRVDAVVTSGATVRAEPGEVYGAAGPGDLPTGLHRWRQEVAGRREPPMVVVMTRSGNLDLDQPLFTSPRTDGRRVAVYTSRETGDALRSAAVARGVELFLAEEPSARDLVRRLRGEEGCRLVSVEAGPSASASLRARGRDGTPPVVRELLLSRFLAPDLPEERLGPDVDDADELARRFPPVGAPREVQEASGPWRFSLHRPSSSGS